MKNFISLIVIVLIYSFTVIEGVDQDMVDCRKVMMVIAKKQLKVFGECSREMREQIPDATEYQEKIQCVVKCAMKREKMLDAEEQISKVSVQKFLDENVPKVFHEMGHMFMDSCLAKFNGKFDVEDPYCKTYGDFIKCMQDRIGDVC